MPLIAGKSTRGVVFCILTYIFPCGIFSFFRLANFLMAYVIIILPFQKYSDILLYLGVVELLYAEHFEIQVGPRDLPLLIKCEQSDPSHFQEDTLRTKQ